MARYSAVVFHVVKSHTDASIGKDAQFHAERTDREPLGCPVARYSAVVVFHVVASAGIAKRNQFVKSSRNVLGLPRAPECLIILRPVSSAESMRDVYSRMRDAYSRV